MKTKEKYVDLESLDKNRSYYISYYDGCSASMCCGEYVDAVVPWGNLKAIKDRIESGEVEGGNVQVNADLEGIGESLGYIG